MYKIKGICYLLDYKHPLARLLNFNRNLDTNTIRNELRIIKEDLGCNAVRLISDSNSKLIEAAEIALKFNLEPWVSNRLFGLNTKGAKKVLRDLAISCEILRKRYSTQIIIIVANEPSLDTRFVWRIGPPSTGSKLEHFFSTHRQNEKLDLSSFISELAIEVKKYFNGPITLASGPWEKIDWKYFDYIGVNLYINKHNKDIYENLIDEYKGYKKPLVITEFGCCTFKGAADYGGNGWNYASKNNVVYDKTEQANTIEKCINIFKNKDVEGSFLLGYVEPKPVTKKKMLFGLGGLTVSAEGSYGIMNYFGKKKKLKPKLSYEILKRLNISLNPFTV